MDNAETQETLDKRHGTETNTITCTTQKIKDVQHGSTELSNYEKGPVPCCLLYIYCTIVVIL